MPTAEREAQRPGRRVKAAQAALRLIERGELLETLDRAVAGKVTIISAPAGSGKTSLLRTWADRPGLPYRLAVVRGQDQPDAQLFWLAVLGAVRQACGAPDAAEPAVATPDFNGTAIVDRVLSELADAPGSVALVIDDLHELASPEVLGQLARLLADLPAQAHVLLSTRRDLPLQLHQLRLAGALAEIRAADLRFSESEAGELLEASGVALSAAGTALLYQRTEGWAAGLRLAALALADHPDPERFVAEFSGSNRTVAEYLIAELLDRQPHDVQQLLLRTSLLDRVNGELAELLTGRPGSERILLELEDANAFVVSLDPERTWFRYHHLLEDFLRLELRRTLPEGVGELHLRAARWFEHRGQVIDAVRHAQAAGDWFYAARLLADHAVSLMLDGHVQSVEGLLLAFPPGSCADHPELAVAHATTDLVYGRLDDVAAQLEVAESHADTMPPDRRRRLQLAIASLKLSLARRRGRFDDVLEQVHLLASPLSGQDGGQQLALDGDLRAVALLNLGIVEAWSLRLKDGERHLREGALLARELGRPYLEVSCLAHLGFASKGSSFAVARQCCQEAVALAERHGWGAEPVIAIALVTLAGTMIWMGEFDEGERWLERAGQAVEADTAPGIRMQLHLVNGMLLAGRGQLHRALEQFAAAEHQQSQLAGSHALAGQVTGWTIATQARLGMLGEARAALAAVTDDRATSGELRNADAAIHLAEGNPTEALGAVQGVLEGTASVIYDFTVVEAWLLAALAHRALGDQQAAQHATERALAVAETERLLLPFAMTCSRELLEALPRHETAHTALLADTLDLLRGSSLTAEDQPASAQTRDLSRSELRVLRYLPTNLSRPQIASELSISLNTVSTHIRSIYAKLGANDRSSAVQQARRLRLLSSARLTGSQ